MPDQPQDGRQQQPSPDPVSAMRSFAEAIGQGIGRAAIQNRGGEKSGSGGSHPERSIWVWGTLIPILLAAVQLMVVSRGDSETLRSLVQNLNITALLLATVLPLASSLLRPNGNAGP